MIFAQFGRGGKKQFGPLTYTYLNGIFIFKENSDRALKLYHMLEKFDEGTDNDGRSFIKFKFMHKQEGDTNNWSISGVGPYVIKFVGNTEDLKKLEIKFEESKLTVLAVDPPACSVPATGGNSIHQLCNGGAARLAFKVKSSNNNEYRLKPVFGFVEANASATLEVIRLNGPPKEDKLVIQYAEVPSEETDPQTPFKSSFSVESLLAVEVVLPLKAE